MEIYKKDSHGDYKEKGKEGRGEYISFSHLECDMCKEKVAVLTPFYLNKLVWEWAGRYQKVEVNPDVNKKYIEICYDCLTHLTHSGIYCVKISKELIDAIIYQKKILIKKTNPKNKKIQIEKEVQKGIC